MLDDVRAIIVLESSRHQNSLLIFQLIREHLKKKTFILPRAFSSNPCIFLSIWIVGYIVQLRLSNTEFNLMTVIFLMDRRVIFSSVCILLLNSDFFFWVLNRAWSFAPMSVSAHAFWFSNSNSFFCYQAASKQNCRLRPNEFNLVRLLAYFCASWNVCISMKLI